MKKLRDFQGAALDAVRLLGGDFDAEQTVRDTVDGASLEEDAPLVQVIVRKYVRRSAWAALVAEDLAQEAQVALAKARSTFNPEKGEWGGYAYRTAWKAIAGFVVSESSPVTRKEKGAPNLGRRAPETALQGFVADVDVEEVYSDAEWRARVRSRVVALSDGDEGVAKVLLEETTPARIAAERGVPVQRVYAFVAAARARVATDSVLYALMQAKKGVEYLAGEQEWRT